MSEEKSSYLQLNLNLGRFGYQTIKSVLKDFDKSLNILPSWKQLRKFQLNITPNILTNTKITGVRFDYIEAIKTTVSRILDIHANSSTDSELIVSMKDGVDGSGSHAIYQQQGNVETHNIIMYMFCILEIKEKRSGNCVFKACTLYSESIMIFKSKILTSQR